MKLVRNLLTTLIGFVLALHVGHQFLSSLSAVEAIDERLFITDYAYYEENSKVPCILSMLKKHMDSGEQQLGEMVVMHVPKDLNLVSKKIMIDLHEHKDHKTTLMVLNFYKETLPKEVSYSVRTKCYILIIKNSDDLAEVILMIKSQMSWNPIAPFIVMFTEHMNDFRLMVQTKSVLQDLFEHSVVDVYVISARDKTSVIQSQTWYPYEGTNCGESVVTVRTVNECEFFGQESNNETDISYDDPQEDDENAGDDELFLLQYDFSNLGPKLPFDLHGCQIRVSAAMLEPFVIKKNDQKVEGFEVVMTRVISEQMHMVPIFKLTDSNAANKFITENNITGLYADLLNSKVDIMIGGMYDNNVSSKLLSSSIGYTDDDMTWCAVNVEKEDSWTQVFAVFSPSLWTFVTGLVFVSGFGLWKMVKFENEEKRNLVWSTVITLAYSMNISAPYRPKSMYIRLFLASFFLYSMYFSAAYQSFLVSVLTRPRYKPQIEDLKTAMKEKFTFSGGENVLDLFKVDDDATIYVMENYYFCDKLEECFSELKNNPNRAIATSRLHAESNKILPKGHMYCFPKVENIHTYSVKMLMRKDFHLLPRFNELIERVAASGLFGKWYSESQSAGSATKTQPEDAIATPLQLRHLKGAFFIWSIGIFVAAVAFGGEWTLFYFSKIKRQPWAFSLERWFCS